MEGVGAEVNCSKNLLGGFLTDELILCFERSAAFVALSFTKHPAQLIALSQARSGVGEEGHLSQPRGLHDVGAPYAGPGVHRSRHRVKREVGQHALPQMGSNQLGLLQPQKRHAP